MPKQHRWEIKQELEAAENNLNTAQYHIVKYGWEFEKPHPETYQMFTALVQALEMIKGSIKQLKDAI